MLEDGTGIATFQLEHRHPRLNALRVGPGARRAIERRAIIADQIEGGTTLRVHSVSLGKCYKTTRQILHVPADELLISG